MIKFLLIFFIIIFFISFSFGLRYYIDSTGILTITQLNEFNDSSSSKSITFNSAGSDLSLGIYIPKNSTIDYAILNITGASLNEWTYDSIYLNISNQSDDAEGIAMNGSKMWIFEDTGSTIIEYNRSNLKNNTRTETGSAGTQGGIEYVLRTWGKPSVNKDRLLIGAANSLRYHNVLSPYDNGAEFSFGSTFHYGVSAATIDGKDYYFMGDFINGIMKLNASGDNLENISKSYDVYGIKYENYKGIEYLWIINKSSWLRRWLVNGSSDGYDYNLSAEDNDVYDLEIIDNELYTVGKENDLVYKYTRTEESNDVSLDVNNTLFFDHTGKLNTTNQTIDFTNYLQDALGDCTADIKGWCNIPINITVGSAGKITLSNLQINYSYNVSSYFNIFNWWNVTENFVLGTQQGIANRYQLVSTPTELNITGFNITGTTCYIDGTVRTVGSETGYNYCNLTTQEIINQTGGTWNNHTIYDASLGTNSPVNQTNGTQSTSTTNQTRYFNVTTYYPNGTQYPNSKDLRIYNVTTHITLTENNKFLNISPTYGLQWYNGTAWRNLNTSNRCFNKLDETETNYSDVNISSLIWRACYNDTNDNNEIDYIKVQIPELGGNDQLLAYHEEDNDGPTITIEEPTGTLTTAGNNSFNVTITDNMEIANCTYNITADNGTVEKSNTIISCFEFNGTFTVSGTDDYYFNVWSNDSAGNINTAIGAFSVDISVEGGSPGGGGGGVPEEDILMAVTQAVETIPICGNGVCQEGENPLTCAVDCPFNVDELFCPLMGEDCPAWVFNFLIIIVVGVPVFITYRKQTKGKRKKKIKFPYKLRRFWK